MAKRKCYSYIVRLPSSMCDHLLNGPRRWGYYVAAGTFACIRIRARVYMTGKRPFVNAEESNRFRRVIELLTSLTLYHDSRFSAFSTEVLAWPNRGTIAVVLLVPP